MITLGKTQICVGKPCFIIAEAGVNHNGSIELAKELVDAAARAGADAVKFQTFKADRLVTSQALKAGYQKKTTGAGESQYEMIKSLELSYDEFQDLYQYCAAKKILFLSTPFEEESADFLDSLGMVAFKIASGEITNLPLLSYIARKGKPMLLSTGMAYLGEVDTAVRTIYHAGKCSLALFHCTSNYPTAPEEVNLRAMHTLAQAFGVPVGYSDHTRGIEISLAAVALGACIIEKHFTLDRNLPGPDHQASIEPDELEALVLGIRKVEASLGDGLKIPVPNELETAMVARKSLVAATDISAGTILTDELIAIKRPGTGMPPALKPALIGRTTRVDIQAGEAISPEMLL